MDLETAIMIIDKIVAQHCITMGVEAWQTLKAHCTQATSTNNAIVLCPACKYGAPCQVGFAGTCDIRPCKLAQHQ